MLSRLAAVALALAVAPLACGGDNSAPRPASNLCRPIVALSDTPDPGSGPVDCHALDGYELLVLDSFEAGAVASGWYVNTDRTAQQQPAPDDLLTTTRIPNGRCVGVEPSANAATRCASADAPRGSCTELAPLESRSGVHIRSGLLSSNGGLLGIDFPASACCDAERRGDETDPKNPCFCDPFQPNRFCDAAALECQYQDTGPPEIGPCSQGERPSLPTKGCRGRDLSNEWEGVVVWARIGPGSAATIRVRAADRSTHDTACICNPKTNQNDSSDACDKAGKYTVLDHTFRPYLIPFREMQQAGYGLKAPPLDVSSLFALGIEYRFGAWDLWIDDVAFYRRKP